MHDLSKVKTKLMLVTPEMAQEWLNTTQRNIDAGKFRQRPISQLTVDRYSRDILLGMFPSIPQTVAIDCEGNVADGRHRLTALVQTGLTLQLNVSTGWPQRIKCGSTWMNLIDFIDRNRPRSVSSQLVVGHNLQNATYHAAVARAIAEISLDAKASLSVPQTILVLEMYKESSEAIRALSGGGRRSVAYMCAPMVFMHKAEPAMTEDFAAKYFTLEGLTKGHPVHSLVKWVEKSPAMASRCVYDTAKHVFACMQAFESNTSLSVVRCSQDAWRWATSKQKDNVRKVRQIMGVK